MRNNYWKLQLTVKSVIEALHQVCKIKHVEILTQNNKNEWWRIFLWLHIYGQTRIIIKNRSINSSCGWQEQLLYFTEHSEVTMLLSTLLWWMTTDNFQVILLLLLSQCLSLLDCTNKGWYHPSSTCKQWMLAYVLLYACMNL